MGEGNSLRKSNQLCWVSKEAGSSWGGGEFMCACACVFYIYFSSAGVGAEVGPSVAGQAA